MSETPSLKKRFIIQCDRIFRNTRNYHPLAWQNCVQEPWASRATHWASMFTSNREATFCQGKVKFTFMQEGSWKQGLEGLQEDYSRLVNVNNIWQKGRQFLKFSSHPAQSKLLFQGLQIQSLNLIGKSILNYRMSDNQFWPNKYTCKLVPQAY